VAWADDTSQLLFSGSDDGLVKVWDRRQLGKEGRPVGVLMGHLEGITHVCSKEDGRYLISNSKDQSIKVRRRKKLFRGKADNYFLTLVMGYSYDV